MEIFTFFTILVSIITCSFGFYCNFIFLCAQWMSLNILKLPILLNNQQTLALQQKWSHVFSIAVGKSIVAKDFLFFLVHTEINYLINFDKTMTILSLNHEGSFKNQSKMFLCLNQQHFSFIKKKKKNFNTFL